jgi:hypothetical protein
LTARRPFRRGDLVRFKRQSREGIVEDTSDGVITVRWGSALRGSDAIPLRSHLGHEDAASQLELVLKEPIADGGRSALRRTWRQP